jgi:hypothetical protein
LDDLLLLGVLVLGKACIDISEFSSVHYIGRRNEGWLAIDRRVSDHNGDVVELPNPGESDVELAVGETGEGKKRAIFLKVWPWDLLIVMAKAGRTGNCRRRI